MTYWIAHFVVALATYGVGWMMGRRWERDKQRREH